MILNPCVLGIQTYPILAALTATTVMCDVSILPFWGEESAVGKCCVVIIERWLQKSHQNLRETL